jgi:hypothetical protein
MFRVIVAWMVLACSTCTVAAITPASSLEMPAAQPPELPAAAYELNRVVLVAGSVAIADSVRQQHPDACYKVTVVLPVTEQAAGHTFDFCLDSASEASSVPVIAQVKLPAALNPLKDAVVHCEQRTRDYTLHWVQRAPLQGMLLQLTMVAPSFAVTAQSSRTAAAIQSAPGDLLTSLFKLHAWFPTAQPQQCSGGTIQPMPLTPAKRHVADAAGLPSATWEQLDPSLSDSSPVPRISDTSSRTFTSGPLPDQDQWTSSGLCPPLPTFLQLLDVAAAQQRTCAAAVQQLDSDQASSSSTSATTKRAAGSAVQLLAVSMLGSIAGFCAAQACHRNARIGSCNKHVANAAQTQMPNPVTPSKQQASMQQDLKASEGTPLAGQDDVLPENDTQWTRDSDGRLKRHSLGNLAGKLGEVICERASGSFKRMLHYEE